MKRTMSLAIQTKKIEPHPNLPHPTKLDSNHVFTSQHLTPFTSSQLPHGRSFSVPHHLRWSSPLGIWWLHLEAAQGLDFNLGVSLVLWRFPFLTSHWPFDDWKKWTERRKKRKLRHRMRRHCAIIQIGSSSLRLQVRHFLFFFLCLLSHSFYSFSNWFRFFCFFFIFYSRCSITPRFPVLNG